MKRWFTRICCGILFAIPLMMVTFVFAKAENPPAVPTSQSTDCASCHPAFTTALHESKHGSATTNEIFKSKWESQGKPGQCLTCHATGYDPTTYTWKADGVTCEICHTPYSANHPLEPMSTYRSAELCGKCHTETHFEWQASGHQKEGLDCIGCHDPHKASLKQGNAESLCGNCHQARTDNFTHSAHSKEGLNCADCHLGEKAPTADDHSQTDHTFFVSLDTCNRCHAYEIHQGQAIAQDASSMEQVDAMASVETLSVFAEPSPVSPVGFTVLAGLIGIAMGVILAPWIENWKNRLSKSQDGEGD